MTVTAMWLLRGERKKKCGKRIHVTGNVDQRHHAISREVRGKPSQPTVEEGDGICLAFAAATMKLLRDERAVIRVIEGRGNGLLTFSIVFSCTTFDVCMGRVPLPRGRVWSCDHHAFVFRDTFIKLQETLHLLRHCVVGRGIRVVGGVVERG